MANLINLIKERSANSTSNIAFECGSENISYGDLRSRLNSLAQYFSRNSVKTGDVVGLYFQREFYQALSLLALANLGATSYSLPKNASTILRNKMMQSVNANIIISDQYIEFSENRSILVEPSLDFDGLIDSDLADPEGPWLIINSSGSTGDPKLICISHETAIRRMSLYQHHLKIGPNDRISSLTSLDLPSTKNQMLSALVNGACYVFSDTDTRRLGEFISRKRITILYTSPAHLHQLLAVSREDMKSVRAVVAAGSLISDKLRIDFKERFGEILVVRYGTSETGPISDTSPTDLDQPSGTVGLPIEGVSVEIVTADGKPTSLGQPGRIKVQSIGQADGYLGQNGLTAFGSGFFPGDLGVLTNAGQLIHLGREDDMMIMNGVNIYPPEIEHVLSKHQAVIDVVVRPQRHEILGDIPIAFVEIFPNFSVSCADLLNFCREHLGPRAPRQVQIIDKIPRNSMGKPDRKKLDSWALGSPGVILG